MGSAEVVDLRCGQPVNVRHLKSAELLDIRSFFGYYQGGVLLSSFSV